MAGEKLQREVGVRDAVLMGLGSILGTGIFVSIGLAAGIAGSAVLIAIPLAAAIAICNGLSSARLAASHPVSGGTYEYAHQYLNKPLALVAGWTFLVAKSASAATAALGFASYVLAAVGVDNRISRSALGIALVAAVTVLVAGGIRRTSRANALIVGVTLVGLGVLVASGLPQITNVSIDRVGVRDLLYATALVFVAFTGYGRIATLGEEVRDPARTIPRAVIIALVVTLLLYVAVVAVALGSIGPRAFASAAAPLEAAARSGTVRAIVAIAAVTAMAGVLLNLVLGLSRVVLAMARRGDLPSALAEIDDRKSPRIAVLAVGIAIGVLALAGNVKLTWTLSAFSVLVYYAITNLAALRLPPDQRRSGIAITGLASCVVLAAVVAWIVIV